MESQKINNILCSKMHIDFEGVEQFQYLGTTLMIQNSVHEEIKSRLKSGNACCYSVQNVLSSSLLSKNGRGE
jgi:hypothetical protein